MARRRSVPLTEVELRLMEIVWASGPATVAQIVEAIPTEERPAYNTVQTMMKILERKGYVQHRAEGRAFVYKAIVDRDAAARTALSQVVQRFFGGSPRALALNLVEGDHLSQDDLDEIRRTIARAKDEP
ncbi:MAG: BlaI/MecI/CopY family transcriptional regulator [Candidatus Eremiobacteraeota bacterium]|nr:BlaI/MecI/CopY family transcriptional regulator [Candidatus Eremiobacteraeota bacterium]MBV9407244.1 BlaI/MecI/CopY family transcriptional regulator [Candidatus Eremiobacteraeota bacterium]